MGAFDLGELLKNPLLVFGRDTRPGVGNADQDLGVARRASLHGGMDDDLAFVRELRGIGEQV